MGIIIFTGTPGTGKTTLARALARKIKAKYIDLNKYLLNTASSPSYDNKRKCPSISPKAILKAIQNIVPNNTVSDLYVIDSHMSHFLPVKRVDFCIVVVCSNLKTLKKRLESRKYSPAKVRENLDCEIFEVCKTEAQDLGHTYLVIDTAKTPVSKAVLKLQAMLKSELKKICIK